MGRILGVTSPLPLGLCPCSTARCLWRSKFVSSSFQGVHGKTLFSTHDCFMLAVGALALAAFQYSCTCVRYDLQRRNSQS